MFKKNVCTKILKTQNFALKPFKIVILGRIHNYTPKKSNLDHFTGKKRQKLLYKYVSQS